MPRNWLSTTLLTSAEPTAINTKFAKSIIHPPIAYLCRQQTGILSGAAALLMQWGITDGNDPFLYGEKAAAYLEKGARPLPAFADYPNPQIGWGTLCLRESLPE